MVLKESKSGILYPQKTLKEEYPHSLPKEKRLKTYTFEVYYKCDMEPFEKLVMDSGGKFFGWTKIDFNNVWNEPITFGSYLGIYQHTEPLTMEVCC